MCYTKAMAYNTVNKDIACTPMSAHAVEAVKQASGMYIAAPRTNLVALTVLAGYEPLGLVVGDLVYVPQEFSQFPWGKRKLKVEGVGEFILVPADQVHLVKKASA